MSIKQITAEEAKKLLDGTETYVYVDVRSEYEFMQGHPAESRNIPLQHFNPAAQMMEPNPDFLQTVEAHFPKDANLLLGCASGHRSQVACQILQQSGYQHLANVRGGFSGARDMFGNLIEEGWLQLGFPVDKGDGGERSYKSLTKKDQGE